MDTKQIAKVMKALSNQNRLELYLEIMKQHETCYETNCDKECMISDIATKLKVGAPTVSHHLKELENAGLISTERSGKFVVAKINENTIDEVSQLLRLKHKS
jgi:ArsR family transcriptional regulator